VAVRVLARVDGWRKRDDKRSVWREWRYYFPVSTEEWVPHIEPLAKRWERYVRPYRWDRHVRPYQPSTEKEEDEKEEEVVELSPELEELKRRLERLKEELSGDQEQ
jgi:hypothetical protein